VARSIVTRYEKGINDVLRASRSERSVLTVGFVASAANELTPKIVAEFSSRRPGWQVEFRQGQWTDPTAGLRDGIVDAALLRTPIPDTEGLVLEELLSEPRVLAVPATHRLAGRDEVTIKDLLDEPWVATKGPAPWRDWWLASELRGDREAVIAVEVDNPTSGSPPSPAEPG
jgi:DNA-binding transcriptional LysR family regulator